MFYLINLTTKMSLNIDIDLMETQLKKKIHKQPNQARKKENTVINPFFSKIMAYDFSCKNEINLSEKIKEIPYYSSSYIIVENADFLEIKEMEDSYIQKLKISSPYPLEKYVLLQYPNETYLSFNDFLVRFHTPKELLSHVLQSYSRIMTSLIQLQENNICFFDLSSKHIEFRENNQPLLQDFQNSFFFNENHFLKIMEKINDYTCKPLEIHVLFYLIQNKEESLSYSYIETIVSFFLKNMPAFSLFSKESKLSYQETCMDSLKKYINLPKRDIICDIGKASSTWDNYSLSILYFHVVGTIVRVFSLKETFMNDLLKVLSKNLSPNPSKRETIQETNQKYTELMNTCTNWSFVNKMQQDKMATFYESV